jgi:hypothetical protein
MQMHWPEATEEQYEQVRRTADWEGNRPEGAKLHVVGFAGDGMRILDIWESAAAFQVWFGSASARRWRRPASMAGPMS